MRILGISPAHDSSVAVINDGKIEFFVKEERLSRIKRDKQPYLALYQALQNCKGKVDAVVLSSPSEEEYTFLQLDLAKKLFNVDVVHQMSHLHHLSHASLAFYNSGFEKSLVVVVDRNGSPIQNIARESETVFAFEYPNIFTEIYKNYWLYEMGSNTSPRINQIFENEKLNKPECTFLYNSCFGITKVYESATTLIGQHILENGKTMGLSAYGTPSEFPSLFLEDGSIIDSYFTHENIDGQAVSIFNKYKECKTLTVSKDDHKLYADYAYQVQQQTQKQVLKLIKNSIKKTGIKDVCITGGYGLNVVANSYYIKNLPDVNFFFEPLADDSGNSIGAAMFLYRELTKDKTIYPLKDTFFNGINHDLSKVNNIGENCSLENIVSMLLDQKSVAIYEGLSEAGPRALGHRSILFDARNVNAKEIVNTIKKREWYRPFAACVLEEDADQFFNMTIKSSDYMTISFDVLSEAVNLIPGVVHVDNTCRIQTITKDNPTMYELLTEFKKQSGIGVLLNTSFNLAGDPLVETPEEALKVLTNSTLDALWFPEVKKVFNNPSRQ